MDLAKLDLYAEQIIIMGVSAEAHSVQREVLIQNQLVNC